MRSSSHGPSIHIVDAGGQQAERTKWIYQFENVTMVIFVVDISSYDELVFEDPPISRLQENFVFYDSIVNSSWTRRSSILLLFNKVDLLKLKLLRNPLKNYFPDYSGGDDVLKATEYIRDRFLTINCTDRSIHLHLINEDDNSISRIVHNTLTDVIIAKNILFKKW
jgi:guanine nucleotide-binding protein G(i) subunit alpha